MHPHERTVDADLFGGDRQLDALQQRVGAGAGPASGARPASVRTRGSRSWSSCSYERIGAARDSLRENPAIGPAPALARGRVVLAHTVLPTGGTEGHAAAGTDDGAPDQVLVQLSGLLLPSLVLHSVGAKSGLERDVTLMYCPVPATTSARPPLQPAATEPTAAWRTTAHHGQQLRPRHAPGLDGEPDEASGCRGVRDGVRIPAHAEQIADDERESVWRTLEDNWPGYRGYERTSGCVWRIFRLTPTVTGDELAACQRIPRWRAAGTLRMLVQRLGDVPAARGDRAAAARLHVVHRVFHQLGRVAPASILRDRHRAAITRARPVVPVLEHADDVAIDAHRCIDERRVRRENSVVTTPRYADRGRRLCRPPGSPGRFTRRILCLRISSRARPGPSWGRGRCAKPGPPRRRGIPRRGAARQDAPNLREGVASCTR